MSFRWIQVIDGGGEVIPPDQEPTATEAAANASKKTPGSFTVQRLRLNVVQGGKYQFAFAYLYEDPENPSETLVGPRSPNFTFTLDTPDLTRPVTNLVVTPGLLSYGVKWDLIDKNLPENKWFIDAQIYESLTGAFAGEEYLVWNGTGNSATILVSDTNNRWIRVDTRDQDFHKKSVISGPFKATDPIVVDVTGPGNVDSVNTSGGLDTTGIVGFNGYANISWPAVTGGGIRGYRIRFRPITTPESSYSYADSPGTGTSYRLAGLGAGLVYEIAVATYDEYNNTSSSYVAGTNVTVGGTPYIASTVDVSGFFRAKANAGDADSTAFKFGYGIETGKRGLLFNASNYWHIDSNQSALFKVGGPTSNYLLWDGAKLTIDGDINAKGGTFSGNIFMSNPSGGKGSAIYSGTIDAATGNLTGNGFALNSTGLKVANGSNSVTLSAANGTITANAGSIGSWNITNTTLSKNNIILDSAGQIQVGSTAAQSVYLKSSGSFVMWAGNNTPDANAKFRVGADGTLYATNAVIGLGAGSTIDGYTTTAVTAGINSRLITVEGGYTTLNTAIGTKNAIFVQDGQPTATKVGDIWIQTNAGNALKTWTGSSWTQRTDTTYATKVALDTKLEAGGFAIATANNQITNITSNGIVITPGNFTINTSQGSIPSSGSYVVLNSAGLTAYDGTKTTFAISSSGSASFSGNLSAATGTIGKVTFGTDNTSNFFETGSTLGGVSTGGISVGAIGFKNTSVGGWTTHCYPYMPGTPNIDLGTRSFRWNDVRISGNLMVGHDGSNNDDNGTTVKIKLLPGGNIYANALGTASTSNFITQSSGFLRVNTSSSRRYKTDIVDIDSVDLLKPENLLDIPVRAFKYNSDHLSESDQRFGALIPGFIAEEVELVYPSAVDYNDDGLPERWNTNMIVPGMLALIQKQSRQIDLLIQRLDALEV
jgi:hypothetical protein